MKTKIKTLILSFFFSALTTTGIFLCGVFIFGFPSGLYGESWKTAQSYSLPWWASGLPFAILPSPLFEFSWLNLSANIVFWFLFFYLILSKKGRTGHKVFLTCF